MRWALAGTQRWWVGPAARAPRRQRPGRAGDGPVSSASARPESSPSSESSSPLAGVEGIVADVARVAGAEGAVTELPLAVYSWFALASMSPIKSFDICRDSGMSCFPGGVEQVLHGRSHDGPQAEVRTKGDTRMMSPCPQSHLTLEPQYPTETWPVLEENQEQRGQPLHSH